MSFHNHKPGTDLQQAKLFCLAFVLFWFLIDRGTWLWLEKHPSLPESPLRLHRDNYEPLSDKAEFLFFGNSQASFAFQPQLIQKYLNNQAITFYNHSIFVGGLAVPALALNRWLDHHPPPTHIVWAITPYEFKGSNDMPVINVANDITFSDLNWIKNCSSAIPVLLKNAIANSLCKTYQDQKRWQATFTQKHMAQKLEIGDDGAHIIDISKDKDNSPETWQQTKNFYHRTITHNFKRNSIGKHLIKGFKKMCDKHNINLILVSLPVASSYGDLYSKDDAQWGFEQLTSTAQELSLEHWDFRKIFDDSHFQDGVHLKLASIDEFNRHLAKRIKSK